MNTKTQPVAIDLLPCPFCGHVGLDFKEGSTFRWIIAECGKCGASRGETRIQTMGHGTKEEWMAQAEADAIEQWNTRASQPVASEPSSGERDKFEAWAMKTICCNEDGLKMGRITGYASQELNYLWRGWNARALLSSDAKPSRQYEIRESTREEMLRDWEQLGAYLFGDAKPASEPMKPWQIMPTVKDRATGRELPVTGVYEDVVFVDLASSEPVAVPQGFVLVRHPVTEEMHIAAVKVLQRAHGLDGLPQRMLDAMLSASTSPAPVGIKKEND